jgi:hypothetical protein
MPMALMRRIKATLWQVGVDSGRVFRGTVAFFQYFCAGEDGDVGLGLLSAESNLARRGQANEYVVRIANAARQSREVTLTIDIAAAHASAPDLERYAYFTKSLTVPPHLSRAIAIRYDWMNHVCFHVDGASSLPDSFCRGESNVPHLYAVTAFLSNGQGRLGDDLTVYQELVE